MLKQTDKVCHAKIRHVMMGNKEFSMMKTGIIFVCYHTSIQLTIDVQ